LDEAQLFDLGFEFGNRLLEIEETDFHGKSACFGRRVFYRKGPMPLPAKWPFRIAGKKALAPADAERKNTLPVVAAPNGSRFPLRTGGITLRRLGNSGIRECSTTSSG